MMDQQLVEWHSILSDPETVVYLHSWKGNTTLVVDGPNQPFGREWLLESGDQLHRYKPEAEG
jgi:hypothetical protein